MSDQPTPTLPLGHCSDTARHDPHRYGDDEFRHCPGATGEDAEPVVCRSPRCPRPGVNGAGFCCHGCASNSRFGHALLHGARCQDANPGVEETPPTLRDQVTGIVYAHLPAAADHPGTTAARIIRDVMEAVQADQQYARADALWWASRQLRATPVNCTALTGPYWYGQGWQDAADYLLDLSGWEPSDGEAERTQLAARVRELEDQLAAVRALVDGHRLGTTRLIPATELAALLDTPGV